MSSCSAYRPPATDGAGTAQLLRRFATVAAAAREHAALHIAAGDWNFPRLLDTPMFNAHLAAEAGYAAYRHELHPAAPSAQPCDHRDMLLRFFGPPDGGERAPPSAVRGRSKRGAGWAPV